MDMFLSCRKIVKVGECFFSVLGNGQTWVQRSGVTTMMSLAFLLAYVLHNMEEAIWMPEFSKKLKRFQHFGLKKKQFRVAVCLGTLYGYFLTYVYFVDNGASEIVKYLYLGFVMIVGFNAIFPHLMATIYFQKYAPGTLTACLLTLPISFYIIFVENGATLNHAMLIMGCAGNLIISLSILMISKRLYKLFMSKALKYWLKYFPPEP